MSSTTQNNRKEKKLKYLHSFTLGITNLYINILFRFIPVILYIFIQINITHIMDIF